MRRLLHNRNFILLWGGQAVSTLGTWIHFVGLNLFVLHLSGSGKVMGTFLFARMVPSLFFGPLGGWLADRYPRRTIMLGCDCLRCLLVLGFLFITNLPAVFALGVVLAAIDKVFTATQHAFLPNLVSKEVLMDGVAVVRSTASMTMVIGPALGATIVSSWSYGAVFLIDAVTFLFSVCCTALITVSGQAERGKAQLSPWHEFRAVAQFFAGHLALAFFGIIRLIDALGSGSYNTALPIFAKERLLAYGAAYGWLYGAWACGQGIGAMFTTRSAGWFQRRRERFFSLAVIVMALGMGGTYHAASLYACMAIIFIGGLGDGVSSVLFNTMLARDTPDELRGKVFGVFTAAMFTCIALGMAISGFLIDYVPLRWVTDACSAFIIAGVIVGYALFTWRPGTIDTEGNPHE